jgi:hypothetical protein
VLFIDTTAPSTGSHITQFRTTSMPPPPVPTNWAQMSQSGYIPAFSGPRVGIPSAFEAGRPPYHQTPPLPTQNFQPPAMGYSQAHQSYTSERNYRAKLSYASGVIDTIQVTVQLLYENGKPKGSPYLVRISSVVRCSNLIINIIAGNLRRPRSYTCSVHGVGDQRESFRSHGSENDTGASRI